MKDERSSPPFVKAVRKTNKKPYGSPKLQVFGDLEKITRDVGGQVTDGVEGSRVVDD